MTAFEWGMLSVAVAGFLVTVGGVLGGCVWAVAKIKNETTERMKAEREHTAKLIASHIAEISNDRKTLEHDVGEMGLSLRRHIETVNRKISEVEIWGRDNYALKNDVKESIGEIRNDIRNLGTEIKADIRNLSTKVDSRP